MLDHALLEETLLPEAERMRALVEDLLLLATADEGGLALRLGDVDLDDIIGGEGVRLRLLDRFTVGVSVHPVRVRGDPARLARVVRNLADNAARHARSTITLGCEVEGDEAIITVADDGPGVPVGDRARVFERFVRLDTGRARTASGSGLGLAIATEIITSHGGTVAVTDAAQGGAKFVLRLPLQGPAQQQPTAQQARSTG
jgi:signal transduction histidine kinase